MKKILIILLVLFCLAGCSKGAESTVSNGEDVIFTYPNGDSYTKQDLYNTMKNNDITTLVGNELITLLASKEEIDISEIKNEAQTYIDDMIAQGYESYINYYYGSKESYVQEYVSYEALDKLCQKYVSDKLDEYVEETTPFLAEIIYLEDKEACEKIIETVNNDEQTFAYAASENGYASEVTKTVYVKDDDLPEEVRTYISNNEIGLSNIIEVTTVTTASDGTSSSIIRYYLVNLISKDVKDFEDDFITKIVSSLDQQTIIENIIEKHDIEIHDQRVYEVLSSSYEALK